MAQHEEKVPYWYELSSQIIGWLGPIILVIIVGGFTDSIAHSLAGRNTHVTVNLTITIVVSFVGVSACLVAFLRIRAIGKEKKRLDGRIRSLEAENERLRAGILPQRLPGLGPNPTPER